MSPPSPLQPLRDRESWLSNDSPWEGEEKPAGSRSEQGVTRLPPCHQAQPCVHNKLTPSLTHSLTQVWPGEAFLGPTKPILPPFKDWDPGSPHTVLLGAVSVLTDALRAAKVGEGGRRWGRGAAARDRAASQLLCDQIHCYLLSPLKSEV